MRFNEELIGAPAGRPLDVVKVDAGNGVVYDLFRTSLRHFFRDADGAWAESAAHVHHGMRFVEVCDRIDVRSVLAMLPAISQVVQQGRRNLPPHLSSIIDTADGARRCAVCGKTYRAQYWRMRIHLAEKHGYTPVQVEEACLGKTIEQATSEQREDLGDR